MLRNSSSIALVVGLVVNAAALAQPPAGAPAPSTYALWEFGTMPRPAFKQVLLGNPAVQRELGLTEAQKKAMAAPSDRQLERVLELLEPKQRQRLDQRPTSSPRPCRGSTPSSPRA